MPPNGNRNVLQILELLNEILWLKPNTSAFPNPTNYDGFKILGDFLINNLKAFIYSIIENIIEGFVFSTENKPFYDTLDDNVKDHMLPTKKSSKKLFRSRHSWIRTSRCIELQYFIEQF